MKRSDINELHYIVHIDNLKSILRYGILCHNKAKKINFTSIADENIQKRRAKVVIPGGKYKLHECANLYFNARNPMMFKRKDNHKAICILWINPAILDEPNVIITDMNASSDYAGFYPSPEGLNYLDKDLIFAQYWTDQNPIIEYRRKSAICAEVLVPDCVAAKFIGGIYVSCQHTYQEVAQLLKGLSPAYKISIQPKLFFQEG